MGVASCCGPLPPLPPLPSSSSSLSRPSTGLPPAWVRVGSSRTEGAGGWPAADRGVATASVKADRADGYTRQQAGRQPAMVILCMCRVESGLI